MRCFLKIKVKSSEKILTTLLHKQILLDFSTFNFHHHLLIVRVESFLDFLPGTYFSVHARLHLHQLQAVAGML